jgi:hypothetical protein
MTVDLRRRLRDARSPQDDIVQDVLAVVAAGGNPNITRPIRRFV